MCTSLKKVIISSSTVEIDDRAFTDSVDAWYYPPLKNSTVLSQVKSSALLYCRENRLKFQQLESPMTKERESMVQLIDHIGFSTTINSSKLKKYIELNDWVQVESTANVTKVIFTKYTEVPFEHSPITI